MPNDTLNEREFELINIIGGGLGSNQRDLSQKMALSLGMTNMLIRRMVSKGFIRITQLNKRKVQYLLTPKGFAEKMRKSVKYTFKTVVSIGLIKDRVKKVIAQLYHDEGYRHFTILGKSDFALLIEMAFNEMGLDGHQIIYVDEVPLEGANEVLVVCKENVDVGNYSFARTVDLVHELARDDSFINHIGDLV